MVFNIQSFITRSMRILQISSRPKGKEFWHVAKICAIGMILIGLLGFVITIFFGALESIGF